MIIDSEHSLVAKLQPSKLIMTVRFCLLALFKKNIQSINIFLFIIIVSNIILNFQGVTKEEFLL